MTTATDRATLAALTELEGHTYSLRLALLKVADAATQQANRVTLGNPYSARELTQAVIAVNSARALHQAATEALGRAMRNTR